MRAQAALDQVDRIKPLEEQRFFAFAWAQEQLEEVTGRIPSDAEERAKFGVAESNGHTSEDLVKELANTTPGDVKAKRRRQTKSDLGSRRALGG